MASKRRSSRIWGLDSQTVQAELQLAVLEAHLRSYRSPGSASLAGLMLLSLRILGLLHPCVGGLQGVTPVTSPLPAFSCNSPQQHTPGAKAFGRKLSLHSFLSILHKEATWRNKSVRRK